MLPGLGGICDAVLPPAAASCHIWWVQADFHVRPVGIAADGQRLSGCNVVCEPNLPDECVRLQPGGLSNLPSPEQTWISQSVFKRTLDCRRPVGCNGSGLGFKVSSLRLECQDMRAYESLSYR